MTFQQIECFLEVAALGNFHQAADSLYLSQPTLSRQISSLESELGVLLLIRDKKNTTLSDIGRVLLPYFQELYDAHAAFDKKVHSAIDSYSKHLVIGLQQNQIFTDKLQNALNAFREKYPNVQVFIRAVDIQEDYDSLMDRSIDCLIFLSTTIPQTERIEQFSLYEDNMCLAVPASHPNAYLDEISYEEIKTKFGDLPLRMINIVYFETPLHQSLQNLLDDFDAEDPYFLTGNEASLTTLYLSVEHGLSCSIMNAKSLLSQNEHVKMIPISTSKSDETLYRNCNILFGWSRTNPNPSLQHFIPILKEEFGIK
jgi:DNA-binding transcriptional LysR family regulator